MESGRDIGEQMAHTKHRCECGGRGASDMTTHHSRLSAVHLPVILSVLLLLAPLGSCQNQNDTKPQPQDDTQLPERPLDKAMNPLYLMTKGFLNLVQPLDSGFILDEADIVDDVVNGDFEVIIMSMEDWEVWVTHYLGFVICACIGVLFIIIMPITGLCFCCCRCCGNCGAKGDMEEKKGDRYKRGACGVLLAIFILILLGGLVCGFVTNELLREQTTKDEERAVLNTVSMELQSLDNFKVNTIQAFRTTVIGAIDKTADDVIGDIAGAADRAKDKLADITDSVDMLDEALELAEATENINRTLTTVKDTTSLLQTDRNILISNISGVRTDIQTTLNACTGNSICDDLLVQVSTLNAQADFSQVDDVTQELDNVKVVLDNNLANLIRQGYMEFEDIADKVEADVLNELNDAKDEVADIKNVVTDEINQITRDLDQLHFNDTTEDLKEIQDDLEEYGNYRYYAGIVLCCLILLIVLFALLGLCFGICGGSAGEDAASCNKGVGATILMVGVAFSFLFAWLLMVIVVVIFLGGGLVYTEVCRFAVDLPNAPRPIKNTINTYVSEQLKSFELEIQFTQMLEDCQDNKALFHSLNLSQIANLSEILDIDSYGIADTINDIVNEVNVDLSDVVIFSNDTRNQLNNLLTSGLIDINFASYNTELDKPLVSPNLTQLANQLDTAASRLDGTDSGTASDLRGYANVLRTIEANIVNTMESHKNQLQMAIPLLESAIDGPPDLNTKIMDLVRVLDTAQQTIQHNGSVYIKQFIRETGDEILGKLKTQTSTLRHEIENDIGRCRPVSTALNNVITAGCVTVLDPFNGFWFCIGMCLMFLIPVIIISVVLIGLYRKTDEYYDDKSFDDVVHWPYEAQTTQSLLTASSHSR